MADETPSAHSTRWLETSRGILRKSLPDTLAFAEARLLTIHPFADLNGRLVRLWLWELLRRLKLPPVQLVPRNKEETEIYLAALRAGDQNNYQPLAQSWMHRLSAIPGQ